MDRQLHQTGEPVGVIAVHRMIAKRSVQSGVVRFQHARSSRPNAADQGRMPMTRKPKRRATAPPPLSGSQDQSNSKRFQNAQRPDPAGDITITPGAGKHLGDDDDDCVDPSRWHGIARLLDRWHFCPLDADCRLFGIVWRLQYSGRQHIYSLALTPGARFCAPGPRWPDEVREAMTAAMRANPRLFFDDAASRRWEWFQREPREQEEAGDGDG